MQMKAIDAKLKSNSKLSAADIGKVKTLRADGEAFYKAGKEVQTEKALGDARKLLGILPASGIARLGNRTQIE